MESYDEALDLRQMRIAANISIAEMAEYLVTSQEQVARFEEAPDDVPYSAHQKWVLNCRNAANNRGLDVGVPMAEVSRRVALIAKHASAVPAAPDDLDLLGALVNPQAFIDSVRFISRKPRVGVFGRFDMGKSRLINVLLGKECMPTSYQPATSVVCLIRHHSDKPEWQTEDVWLMKKGFKLDRVNDQAHCLEHRIAGGDYAALKKYGTHTGAERAQMAFAAVVYADAAVLQACDILDLPGYGHSDDDKDRAEMAEKYGDVMLYLSTAQGFLDQNDLNYLSVLMRQMPQYESVDNGVQPLRNLFVLATRADVVGDQIGHILEAGSLRAYRHFDKVLEQRTEATGVPIRQRDFQARFFSFSADHPALRAAFECELKFVLGEVLPVLIQTRLTEHVAVTAASGVEQCDKWIKNLTIALNEQEKVRATVASLRAQEPMRLSQKKNRERHVITLIDTFRKESAQAVSDTFSRLMSVKAIEALIKKRYDNKKEAQQLAPSYLLEMLQSEVGNAVKVKADKLAAEVDLYLGEYEAATGSNLVALEGWDFDARGAFMGALAGVGTFGALAAWASLAAAGSNLGAYLLVPTVVSALSSIGIGVGGTGAAVSLVSVLGGPVTIGVGIAVAVGSLLSFLFGASWESKLAKKIHESFCEEKAEAAVLEGVETYWNNTRSTFSDAAAKVERVYQNSLDGIYKMAFATASEDIGVQLAVAKTMRQFYADIPVAEAGAHRI